MPDAAVRPVDKTAPADPPSLGPFLIQKPASHLGPAVRWFTDMFRGGVVRTLSPRVMIPATFVARVRAGAVVANAAPACCEALPSSFGNAVTSGISGHRLPITKVIEPGPLVDRSAAPAAMKVTGALLRLLFLACRINSRAVRAGEMDDQLEIVRHSPMMDLDSALFQRGD